MWVSKNMENECILAVMRVHMIAFYFHHNLSTHHSNVNTHTLAIRLPNAMIVESPGP